MAPRTTNLEDASSEEPASVRVATFLEYVEKRRRRTVRVRAAAAAVGALVATFILLTSLGVFVPGAARLAASAGTLVTGIVGGNDGHAHGTRPMRVTR